MFLKLKSRVDGYAAECKARHVYELGINLLVNFSKLLVGIVPRANAKNSCAVQLLFSVPTAGVYIRVFTKSLKLFGWRLVVSVRCSRCLWWLVVVVVVVVVGYKVDKNNSNNIFKIHPAKSFKRKQEVLR